MLMYIVEVVPLIKIPSALPQVLSYFSARQLPAGALVLVPIGRRQEKAVVIETHEIKSLKMEIKSADYELRPIKKILSDEPILTPQQIKLALWLGQYYFASPGMFLRMMLPKKNQNDNSKFKIKNQTLILFPTMTQAESYAKNFPNAILIHSGLRTKQLNENWQKVASGKAEIIIGTRLATFAPFVNLKEITIEDVTNSGHCSWDMFPHYRVHEIARKLTEIFNAKLKIKGAPPSIESFYLSPSLIFPISLPLRGISRRKTIFPLIVDLRQELREGNFSIFSRPLQKAINEALEKKQQIILFINRRGAATFVLCRDCGYVTKCQNCDAPLTYHLTRSIGGLSSVKLTEDRPPLKLKPLLICHHCGQKTDPPTLCPKCQSHRIKAFGSGTQRVETEAEKLFKDAKILRLDSDVAEKPSEQIKIIAQFQEKKADILIGTQMILNYDLPKSAVVAIISADTLMHLPDFRSDERLFQTISQLKSFLSPILPPPTGDLPKGDNFPYLPNFILQTYNPQNKILQMAAEGNFEKFYEQEIETRKILKYPPFSQLIKLTYRHRDPKRAGTEAKILTIKLTQQLNSSKIYKDAILDLLGPSPVFISKQKGKYVWQIILKAKPYWTADEKNRPELLKTRNKFLSFIPPGWEIDIDPETLL